MYVKTIVDSILYLSFVYHEGKGFLTKDDFIRAFEHVHMTLKPETIENAFKYLLFMCACVNDRPLFFLI
jgi:hypothetical protein